MDLENEDLSNEERKAILKSIFMKIKPRAEKTVDRVIEKMQRNGKLTLLEELCFHCAVHKELELIAENLFEVQVSDNLNLDDFDFENDDDGLVRH
jgi:F0F1-type ATP synthase delta subunit